MEIEPVTKSTPRFWSGVLLIVAGSILLSAKGIISKLLYAEGLNFQEVITVRSVLAIPLFWMWGIYAVGIRPLIYVEKKAFLGATFAGAFCYFVGGTLNFYALTLIDAGLERILLYTYPSIIVIALSLWQRRLPSTQIVIALAMTYVGVLLAIGIFDISLREANMLGSSLVLFCAFTYGIYFIVNDLVGQRVGSVVFTVHAMTVAAVAICIHYSLTQSISELEFNATVGWLFSILVVFVTVIPLFMLAEGVRQIGAQRASLISTVGPASTILLAAVILGESMQWFQYLGVVITLFGIMYVESHHKQSAVVQEN